MAEYPQYAPRAAVLDEAAKRIGPAQITNSGTTTLYTTPSKKTMRLTNFFVGNSSASAVTLKVYIVTSGGTAADSNAIVNGISIPANGALTWSADTGFIPLHPGETIQATASAATSLVFVGGGTEI